MVCEDFNSERKKGVPLLEKFRCRICEKVKQPNLFSNKELDKYRSQWLRGSRPTFQTAQLRCRSCAGDSRSEMPCKGPCGLYKQLDDFSKSARLNGGSGYCQLCVLWKESQEPGIATTAPPSETLGPVAPLANTNVARTYDDPEMGFSDEEDDYDHITASSIIVPNVPSRSGAASHWVPSSSVNSAAQSMAHLTLGGSIQQRPALSAISSAPLAGGAPNIDISKPNPWQSGKVLDGDEWHQAKSAMTFNAWDKNGTMHTQQYTPSEATSTSCSNVYETTSVASYVTPPARGPPVKESKWAKPIGTKNAAWKAHPQPKTENKPPKSSPYYDDGSEDDEDFYASKREE